MSHGDDDYGSGQLIVGRPSWSCCGDCWLEAAAACFARGRWSLPLLR